MFKNIRVAPQVSARAATEPLLPARKPAGSTRRRPAWTRHLGCEDNTRVIR